MRKFGKETKHIIDCRDINSEIITRSWAMKLSYWYKFAMPRFFPISPINCKSNEDEIKELHDSILQDIDSYQAIPGLQYVLYPWTKAEFVNFEVVNNEMTIDKEELRMSEELK